jgi:YebC/PmpR family DNA-binding regulatory protein
MSGHNKFSKIKHKKAASDAAKSKTFSRLSKFITNESKLVNGDTSSPSLAAAIDVAKRENMPKDTIERAVKKGTDTNTASMDPVTYETYGPGGSAVIIEALTDNKNRTAGEVRHTLSKLGYELANPGSATWAFTKKDNKWEAHQTVDLSDEDKVKLLNLFQGLEENEDVQGVYSNAS